ncbi:MAG: L,D-transpeptidase family protein [Veillonellaceae bacterium]|nr:L,D-transpeptidase family protein [Veillonellaceae bacterium]
MRYFPGNTVFCLLLIFLMLLPAALPVQAVTPERLGLDLVDVAALDAAILSDLKYATTDNFTGQVLYPSARCLLRAPVAWRLLQVQRDLRSQGLGLKVFDCYRPLAVQQKMWSIVPDENYVANPATGSRHNRGASVDVGLVDSAGRELPMPSKFDEFSERSHLDFADAPADTLRNRQTLQAAMRKEGFLPVTTEWWHFDAPDWRNFALADADSRLVPGPATEQVLAVAEPAPGRVSSALWGLEKTPQGWRNVFGPIPVVLGRSGIAAFEQKREGDGKTPRGVFTLGPVFGYAATAPTRMPYRQATAEDAWVDEPSSPRYNQWVKGIPAKESHEKMRRADGLYQLGAVIGYNTDPVMPGRGSAIFLHVWKGPGQPTSGCVAMALPDLERLVGWLDPARQPRIILGYRGE